MIFTSFSYSSSGKMCNLLPSIGFFSMIKALISENNCRMDLSLKSPM